MQLNRRDFLRWSAAGAGVLLLDATPSQKAVASPAAMAMVYDATKCVGCKACQVACKRWNKLPPESAEGLELYDSPLGLSATTWTLIKVRKSTEGNKVLAPFIKYQCMHCAQASCVSVCPTGAAAHHGEYVLIDQTWCIGCGYCVAACPFDVPHLGEPKSTARKCTFCIDRVTQGQWPACAEACPVEALTFGPRAELLAMAKERVQTLRNNGTPQAHLYGETELGGLGYMCVLREPASLYGLPDVPRLATMNVLGQWLSGLVTAGVIAAVPFWLFFRRREELVAKKKLEGGGG